MLIRYKVGCFYNKSFNYFLFLISIVILFSSCKGQMSISHLSYDKFINTTWVYNELIDNEINYQGITLKRSNLVEHFIIKENKREVLNVLKYFIANNKMYFLHDSIKIEAELRDNKIYFDSNVQLVKELKLPLILHKERQITSISPKTSIVKVENGKLYVSSKYSKTYDCNILFQKCMFNNLMTFYDVSLINNISNYPSVEVGDKTKFSMNIAYSDNIGPILIKDNSWIGGNHSFKEDSKTKTAKTIDYSFYANGKELNDGDYCAASNIKVKVTNNIFNPIELDSVLCIEEVEYNIVGSNIDVSVEHRYINKNPITVATYYGMQSMANGDEMFIPQTIISDFVKKGNCTIEKSDANKANCLIQRATNKMWYESAFLYPNIGIGNHSSLSDNDPIILQSGTKMYHVLLKNIDINNNKYNWAGIYSWYKPLLNNEDILSYFVQSMDETFLFVFLKKNGNFVLNLPNNNLQLDKSIYYSHDVDYKVKSNSLEISGSNSSFIVFNVN